MLATTLAGAAEQSLSWIKFEARALAETTFILIETPAILTASWFAAHWLLHRYAVQTLPAPALMGALAFSLLMIAEVALAVGLSGQTRARGSICYEACRISTGRWDKWHSVCCGDGT